MFLRNARDGCCPCTLETPERNTRPFAPGPDANGQLLIFHDMFGLYPRFKPKMAKVYGNAGEVILNGLKQYVEEVQNQTFPQPPNQ